jgi:hypothetical protein
MKRKAYNPEQADMKTIVPIHNAVNERAWKEIKEWEKGRGSERYVLAISQYRAVYTHRLTSRRAKELTCESQLRRPPSGLLLRPLHVTHAPRPLQHAPRLQSAI